MKEMDMKEMDMKDIFSQKDTLLQVVETVSRFHKAKRADNGEWVYGYYAVIGNKAVIIRNHSEEYFAIDEGKSASGNEIVPIDASTLCRCTGRLDKNTKFIWENNIIIVPKRGKFRVRWSYCDAMFYFSNGLVSFGFNDYDNLELEVVGECFDSF